jgi:D-alanine-D-alanine ligase
MKKNIVVLCGGRSAEHEISVISTRNIVNAIDINKYNIFLIGISRQSVWYHIDEIDAINHLKIIDDNRDENNICTIIKEKDATYLKVNNGLKVKLDIAFPVLHGPYGEDGTIQGMFEMMNLPYVGPNVISSAVSMDKAVFKQVLQHENIPIAPFVILHKNNKIIPYQEIIDKLNSEILFVKPACLGSSIGISKVRNEKEYNIAIVQAFLFDHKIIVEAMCKGREIECAILGNENPKASILGEIIPNHDFYSYDAKYLDPNGADLVAPAVIDENLTNKIQEMAIKAFKAVGCIGMSRVDFFVDGDSIIVNEINTIPGFTKISMYPRLWQESGVAYSNLINELISYGFKEYERKNELMVEQQS